MLAICLGVVKNSIKCLLSKDNVEYSLKEKIDEIDEKLLRCRPPAYIQQAPRKLSQYT